jgi:AraC family transcriptional regulator, positive regulator of tynA and feaB
MNSTSVSLKHWSTASVPPDQRLDYWIGAISEGFLAMVASASNAQFHGELTSAPLGQVGVNQVQADGQEVWRTHADIARNSEQNFYLLGNINTPWSVNQDGRAARMQAGDFVLVDSRRPYHFSFDADTTTVSLELPLAWLTRWIAEPELHTACPFRAGEATWGGSLAAFALPWRPEMVLNPPLPAQLLTDQLGALLALACAPVGFVSTEPKQLTRVLDAIRQRLSEPGLSACDVAGSVAMSVRSLHRLMASNNTTFANTLMQERMLLAKTMLGNPRLRRVTIAEIGRRVGILDPSHFARLCQRWLGALPSNLR